MKNRPTSFNYNLALENDLPIGSGMIESSRGHILQSHLKMTGMAWTLENVDPVLQLHVWRANDKWEHYWRDITVA